MEFKKLSSNDVDSIVTLGCELSPYTPVETIRTRMAEMFQLGNYHCFGVIRDGYVIGISSGWASIRLYSGKQLEIDNFIISKQYQAQGIGKDFLCYIETWAKKEGFKTIELNTFVTNAGSHKFYFNQGYTIQGYQFQKPLQ